MIQLAAKLLSAVEASADHSHQHEFHAGRLRTALGFDTGSNTGELSITYVEEDSTEPEGESCRYTLYNAREGKERAPEFRLYFDSTTLQERANPGDILIVLRSGAEERLRAIVIKAHSHLGSTITRLLSDNGTELKEQFAAVKTTVRSTDLAHLLSETAAIPTVPDSAMILGAAKKTFLENAIRGGALPGTKEMSTEAVRIMTQLWPGDIDADAQLFWSLEVETALFAHLEEQIGQKSLNELAASGQISFADATALVLGRLQSRKSRRGQSLQNHFAAVLSRFDIPFGAQCVTEQGETPDFIVPGCAEYSDPGFPSRKLRMVACKSTVKERWGQILKEAERIPDKYLLTLDEGLTDDGVSRMRSSKLSIFLPKAIIQRAYSESPVGRSVGTVSALVDQLSSALRQ